MQYCTTFDDFLCVLETEDYETLLYQTNDYMLTLLLPSPARIQMCLGYSNISKSEL